MSKAVKPRTVVSMMQNGAQCPTAVCQVCNYGEWKFMGGPHATQRARDLFRNEGWTITRALMLCPEHSPNKKKESGTWKASASADTAAEGIFLRWKNRVTSLIARARSTSSSPSQSET